MYTLGLDIGSSSVKAAVFDLIRMECVCLIKYPEEEMKIFSPFPGWAEQDVGDWWAYSVKAIQLALSEAKLNGSEIKAIGIAYQMHGLVCVDKLGNAVRQAIIWCDSRSVEAGNMLSKNISPQYQQQNLLNHPSNFTAAKLKWIKEFEPDRFEQIHKIMLPGDYIAYKMSGAFTTTVSGMSEGIFWDFKNHQISDEVLKSGDFSCELFPDVGPSFGILCHTDLNFEKTTGIKKLTPISYRAGDQPNNAFATGVINTGQAAATAGTSGVIYAVSGGVKYDEACRINSFAHVNHTKEHPCIGNLLCINGTGIFYSWLRKNLYFENNYEEIEKVVSMCPLGADGLIALPFGNGSERMFSNRIVGGGFYNLDLNRHDKSHLVRAGIEGIAFAFFHGLCIMKELGCNIDWIRAGNDNLFQSQTFTNTLSALANIKIEICLTTGAVGAARGAAFGAHFLTSIEEAFQGIKILKTVTTNENAIEIREAYDRWHKKLKLIINENHEDIKR